MKSWHFPGGPGSLPYRLFDAVRRHLNRWLVEYLTSKLPRGRARVLEAGSGPAFASTMFARQPGVLAVALDIDPDALQEARRHHRGLPAVVGDAHAMPFRSDAFDMVWSSSTLEHLARPDAVLTEMKRVATRGGHVFVGVPYRWGPLGFQPWIARTALGEWVGPVYAPAELVSALRRADLEPTELIVYFFRFFIGALSRKP